MVVHSCLLKRFSVVKLSSLFALSLLATYSYADMPAEDPQPEVITSQELPTPIANTQVENQVSQAQKSLKQNEPLINQQVKQPAEVKPAVAPTSTVKSQITPTVKALTADERTIVTAEKQTETPSIDSQALSQEKQANNVLDNLLLYATTADWDNYFALYSRNAVFIGTDATEHWNMVQFEQYARPTKGWNYTLIERKTVRHDNVIVFDEILDSKSYGISRGTGTLLLTEEGWKVAQYHLSFPIPNDIAKKVTTQIKATRKK